MPLLLNPAQPKFQIVGNYYYKSNNLSDEKWKVSDINNA